MQRMEAEQEEKVTRFWCLVVKVTFICFVTSFREFLEESLNGDYISCLFQSIFGGRTS